MTYVIKGLIVFFSTLTLIEIFNYLNKRIFSVVEGNTGFKDYKEDTMLMAREQESKLKGLKEEAEGLQKYHKQFDKMKLKVDEHNTAIADLTE